MESNIVLLHVGELDPVRKIRALAIKEGLDIGISNAYAQKVDPRSVENEWKLLWSEARSKAGDLYIIRPVLGLIRRPQKHYISRNIKKEDRTLD